MFNKKPFFSILIPAFNHETHVQKCIFSALEQNYEKFEVIAVDDCSTDKTAEKIKEIDNKKLIFVQNEFNRGLNGNLNKAFEKSRGDYIIIIGSDDFFAPDYLQNLATYIENNPDCTVFYPKIVPVDDNDRILTDSFKNQHEDFSKLTNNAILKRLFLEWNFLTSPGMAFPVNAAKKIFPLDAGIHQHQDFIMHIQLLLTGNCCWAENCKLCYRIPTDNNGHMSSNNVKATKRIEIETPHALNYFVKGIKAPEKLKEIFGELVTKYGEPTTETIPYFLARIALDATHNRFLPVWGFRTLIEYISADNHQELLYKLYGFQYKDFSALFNNVRLLDDYLQDQQQTIYSSTSWKITKPLRNFSNFMQNLKGKTK